MKIAKRKTLSKKFNKVNENKKQKFINSIVKEIAEVYDRFTDLSLEKYRRRYACDNEFKTSLIKWKPNDFNPIINMINYKMWYSNKLYISMYFIPKEYVESWCALSYQQSTQYVYVPLNEWRIIFENCYLYLAYPKNIKEAIVKWKYKEIEKAIDLFCKTLKKKEWWFIS